MNPINIPANNNIPSAEYKFLYIRKPEESNYGKNLGDIDFVLDCEDYQKLKSEVIAGKYSGASIYNRPGWDNIQLSLPQFNVVAYISTAEMAEKVRVKFD